MICLSILQAKYIAQIVVLGAQVVGRAFTRAVKYEYAGRFVIMRFEISMRIIVACC